MSRAALAAWCVGLFVLPLVVAAPPASADSYWGGRDPARNISPVPAIQGSVCDSRPNSLACDRVLVRALNHARSVMGLRTYSLPSRFNSLGFRDKLITLTNRDRAVFGLPPVTGLNKSLNRSAQDGVLRRGDPEPVPVLGGSPWTSYSSNWAGGGGAIRNPAFAYYEWMYEDGLDESGHSNNIDCTPAHPAGCWGHRHNTLLKVPAGRQLVMGAGGGSDGRGSYGFTELYQQHPASARVPYLPSVIALSAHTAPTSGGRAIVVRGWGFVRVSSVLVVGRSARITSRTPAVLSVKVPAHAAGSGHLVVVSNAGRSARTYAASFQYLP